MAPSCAVAEEVASGLALFGVTAKPRFASFRCRAATSDSRSRPSSQRRSASAARLRRVASMANERLVVAGARGAESGNRLDHGVGARRGGARLGIATISGWEPGKPAQRWERRGAVRGSRVPRSATAGRLNPAATRPRPATAHASRFNLSDGSEVSYCCQICGLTIEGGVGGDPLGCCRFVFFVDADSVFVGGSVE